MSDTEPSESESSEDRTDEAADVDADSGRPSEIICPRCGGTGFDAGGEQCENCLGAGTIVREDDD